MKPHHIEESRDLAEVGNGVFVGNYHACDHVGHEFPNVVHITRNRDGDRRCRCFSGSTGLQVWWREEEGLDKLSVPLPLILEYAKRPGDLLVHCREGICRSTAIALACKIARGCDPWQAIADVNKGQWQDRRHVACWNPRTLGEILAWFGA